MVPSLDDLFNDSTVFVVTWIKANAWYKSIQMLGSFLGGIQNLLYVLLKVERFKEAWSIAEISKQPIFFDFTLKEGFRVTVFKLCENRIKSPPSKFLEVHFWFDYKWYKK